VPGQPPVLNPGLSPLAAPDQSIHALSGEELAALQRDRSQERGVLDLIWKIGFTRGKWSATLRTDRSVVVTAADGDKLRQLLRYCTIAIMTAQHELE
jgi:hypothetical protein